MDMAEKKTKILASIKALPPLPATAQQALSTFADEFVDADQITAIVGDDAAISGKLIGLANSAYYGLADPVDNIQDAVARVIGVETVRSLVLAMAMQNSLRNSSCPAFDAERFWRESLLTAQCCKKIAKRDPVLSDHERRLSYLAGLCHNLGLMALACVAPADTNDVLSTHIERHEKFDQVLADRIGLSHREATVQLAMQWELPEKLCQAFECRTKPQVIAESRLGLILISAASAVGNLEIDEHHRFDLDAAAEELGVAVDELQKMALPGERQREQIETLARNMGR